MSSSIHQLLQFAEAFGNVVAIPALDRGACLQDAYLPSFREVLIVKRISLEPDTVVNSQWQSGMQDAYLPRLREEWVLK